MTTAFAATYVGPALVVEKVIEAGGVAYYANKANECERDANRNIRWGIENRLEKIAEKVRAEKYRLQELLSELYFIDGEIGRLQ